MFNTYLHPQHGFRRQESSTDSAKKEIPIERLLSSIPPLPKGKKEEVEGLVKDGLAVWQHRLSFAHSEVKALKAELEFHRMVKQTQDSYCSELMNALRYVLTTKIKHKLKIFPLHF